MTLYHFCPAHMLDGIKRQGLTLGAFPLQGDGHFTPMWGFQWLTSEPDPKKQSWATSHFIDYSRTAYRLTIEIPHSHKRSLFLATDFIKHLKLEQKMIVLAWAGHEAWYIFKGNIPPKWIKKIERMDANIG